MINCLIVGQNGAVYAGTDKGLAYSIDRGISWRYVRGIDASDKTRGFRLSWVPALLEDHISCLALDQFGNLWIGHWRSGFEVLDPKKLPNVVSPISPTTPGETAFVSSILPAGNETVLLGSYGSGLLTARFSRGGASAQDVAVAAHEHNMFQSTNPPLPSSGDAITFEHMIDMLHYLNTIPPEAIDLAPLVTALDDDWLTEGQWLGRYGRYWACLCAMASTSDLVWGTGPQPVDYKAVIGNVHAPNDVLRSYVQWQFTDNPKSLELPPLTLRAAVDKKATDWRLDRREAENDDHGEAYPYTIAGPDIYFSLNVPSGLYYLSLYDFNKDGHDSDQDGAGWCRDFRISIRQHTGRSLADISGFTTMPELAHGRICSFWGGVWKRFLVRGPISLTIRLERQDSLDTILPAVTLDLVDEEPPLYYKTFAEWLATELQDKRHRTQLIADWKAGRTEGKPIPLNMSSDDAANRIMDKLDQLRLVNPVWWAANGPRFYAALIPWYVHVTESDVGTSTRKDAYKLLATCYYQTHQFSQWEDCLGTAGIIPARQIEMSLRDVDPNELTRSKRTARQVDFRQPSH